MKRWIPHIALTLLLAQLLLMLVSWMWSAAMPASGVRSLLSGEGIRWIVGYLPGMLASRLLVWLLMLAMAWGVTSRSSLFSSHHSYRRQRAFWLSLTFLGVYVVVILALTVVPHAVLLSASGSLWASPFSASLVPLLAFGLLTVSLIYGLVAGTFESLADIFQAMTYGIRLFAPLLLFYMLSAQLFFSLLFVLP